jgi:hypothetical protein
MLHLLFSITFFLFSPGKNKVWALIGSNLKPSTSIFRKAIVVSEVRGANDQLAEINVRYKLRYLLRYDPCVDRYVSVDDHQRNYESPQQYNFLPSGSTHRKNMHNPVIQAAYRLNRRLVPFLKSSFLPEGVSQNYYSFMKWRALQRFISANLHVLTTQSLLLGLGLKNRSAALGVSAAVNWVLKDALGKISRMFWGMCSFFYSTLHLFSNASRHRICLTSLESCI